MKFTPRRSTRLGIVGLGAVVMLATPYVGVLSANAVTASSGDTIQFVNPPLPFGGSDVVSELADGTNSTVFLAADVIPGTGSTHTASVRFSYKIGSAAPVQIATVSSPPYVTEWAPPSTGSIQLVVEALASDGVTVLQQATQQTSVNQGQSLYVNYPTPGGQAGYFDGKVTGVNGRIAIHGTRSGGSGNNVYPQSFNTPTGEVAPTTTGMGDFSNASSVSLPAGAGGAWATANSLLVDGSHVEPKDGAPVRVYVGAVTNPDAMIFPVTAYLQHVTSFVVSPTQNVAYNGGTLTSGTYTVTALDQFSKPIYGLDVLASVTSGAGTLNNLSTVEGLAPSNTSGVTDAFGHVTFTVHTPSAGVTNLQLQSAVNGSSYDNTKDFQATTSFNAYTRVATTLQLSATPSQSLYANGAEYDGVQVRGRILDQFNVPWNGIVGSPMAVPNLLTKVTRTSTPSGSGTTGPRVTGAPDVNGYVTIAHYNPSAGLNGSDRYDMWVESNSTPDLQPSDTPQATPLTLNFTGGTLAWTPCAASLSQCNTQANLNNQLTETVTVLRGTTPGAGDNINFVTGGSAPNILPTIQPSGTIRDDATHAHCTASSAGTCQIFVNSPTAGTGSVLATDTNTNASQVLSIDFRTGSLKLTYSTLQAQEQIAPFFTSDDEVATPGEVLTKTYQLLDTASQPLRNITGTFSVDHGFFTPNATGGTYDTLSFITRAAGQNVGQLTNLGSTIPFQTDNNGNIMVTFGIGRDAAFDQLGTVDVHPIVNVPTAPNVGGASLQVTQPADSVFGCGGSSDNIGPGHLCEDFTQTWSTNTGSSAGFYNAASTGAVTVVEASGLSLTGLIPTTQTRNALIFLHDQFGNLTRDINEGVTVASAGVGAISSAFNTGSYLASPNPVLISNNTFNPNPNAVHPFDDGTEGAQTVTGTWNNTGTDWATSGMTTIVQHLFSQADCNGNPSDCAPLAPPVPSFQIAALNWYRQAYSAANGAMFTITHTPAGDVFKTGTTVSELVTALDQHNAPLIGLCTTIFRSGPAVGETGNTAGITNANGQYGTTFAGSSQGDATLTAVITDGDSDCDTTSGIERARIVDVVSFDSTPSIAAPALLTGGNNTFQITGNTRPGATVTLYRQQFGTPGFSAVDTTMADPDGHYSFTQTIDKQSSYNVQSDGVSNFSATRTVNVALPLHLAILRNSGGLVTMRATTSAPDAVGRPVYFYRYSGLTHTTYPYGRVIVSSAGIADRTFNTTPGQSLYIYATVLAPSAPQDGTVNGYSNSIAFVAN